MEVIDKGYTLPDFCPELYEYQDTLSQPGQNPVKKYKLKDSANRKLLPEYVAKKEIQATRPEGEDKREYKILLECQHKNIIQLYYWQVIQISDHTFLQLYMEYCDQNLISFYQEHENIMTDSHILPLCLQLLEALKYLHEEKQVTHRDIKPENVLVNRVDCPSKAVVKLADFGLARGVPSASEINPSYAITACGTKYYASPEMLHGIDNHRKVSPQTISAADMFSLGVVIFEMFTKDMPFTLQELRDKSKFEEAFPIEYCPFAKKFNWNLEVCPSAQVAVAVAKMLQYDPKKRPSAKVALSIFLSDEQSPEVSEYINIMARTSEEDTTEEDTTEEDTTEKEDN